MQNLWQLLTNPSLLIILAPVVISVIAGIVKQANEQAKQRQARDARRAMTGQQNTGSPAQTSRPNASGPGGSPDEIRRRLVELAEQRRQQAAGGAQAQTRGPARSASQLPPPAQRPAARPAQRPAQRAAQRTAQPQAQRPAAPAQRPQQRQPARPSREAQIEAARKAERKRAKQLRETQRRLQRSAPESPESPGRLVASTPKSVAARSAGVGSATPAMIASSAGENITRNDLIRGIVMSEILSPPVALRRNDSGPTSPVAMQS